MADGSAGSRASVLAALAANSGIAVTKLIAAAVTGSTSMLAEGFHSVADTGNQLLLLFGIHRSRKPADEEHAFGHGAERFFWTFVVALALFMVGGVVSIYRGVTGLAQPEEPPNLWISVVVLVASAFFEGSALRVALRRFNQARGARSFWVGIRRAKDPETLTVVFEDTAALSGLTAALVAIVLANVFDDSRWDAGGAIVVGAILCVWAVFLARESKDMLLGESATREMRRAIRAAVERDADVDEIRDLLTMHVSPEEVLVNLEINFRNGLDTDGVEDAIRRVEDAIRADVPTAGKIFVEPRRSQAREAR